MTTVTKVQVLWVTATCSEEVDGIHLAWSNVNQAWFLMWKHEVLGIINDKAEAEQRMMELINE